MAKVRGRALGLTGVSIRVHRLVAGRVCRVGQQGVVSSGDGGSRPDPFHDATRWRTGKRDLFYVVMETGRQDEWCAAALRTPPKACRSSLRGPS